MPPARRPQRPKRTTARRIKHRDLGEGVVAAAMGVAGAIGEFFQLAKHRGIDFGPQDFFQLGQGGDFLQAQELTQTLGVEGGCSHNAIVPPLIKYQSGTIAELRASLPARWEHRKAQLESPKRYACPRRPLREWRGILP